METLGILGMLWPIFCLVAIVFLMVWPLLIWSHLREQTKLLKQILAEIQTHKPVKI